MAYSGVLDDVRACANLGFPRRVPIFGGVSSMFNAKLAGITWAEYTHDVNKLVNCEVDAVKRFDYDWVYLNPDDNIEFEPLGVKTKGEGNVPLGAYEFLPADETALARLKVPDFHRDGRMPAYLEAISRVKGAVGDSVCVTGRVAAPFSSVTLLFGQVPSLCLLMENPDLFDAAARFCIDLMIGWGKAQIRAGADAIWVGDCVAGSGFISPRHYSGFAQQGASRVNAALKEHALVFYHAGDSSVPHLRLMADTQPHVLSIGGNLDMAVAKEEFGGRMALMGNIRGIEVLMQGTCDLVRSETARIMSAGKPGGGYVFNSEEGIPYETPSNNMAAMMSVAKEHSAYPG